MEGENEMSSVETIEETAFPLSFADMRAAMEFIGRHGDGFGFGFKSEYGRVVFRAWSLDLSGADDNCKIVLGRFAGTGAGFDRRFDDGLLRLLVARAELAERVMDATAYIIAIHDDQTEFRTVGLADIGVPRDGDEEPGSEMVETLTVWEKKE